VARTIRHQIDVPAASSLTLATAVALRSASAAPSRVAVAVNELHKPSSADEQFRDERAFVRKTAFT